MTGFLILVAAGAVRFSERAEAAGRDWPTAVIVAADVAWAVAMVRIYRAQRRRSD